MYQENLQVTVYTTPNPIPVAPQTPSSSAALTPQPPTPTSSTKDNATAAQKILAAKRALKGKRESTFLESPQVTIMVKGQST